MYTVAIVEDNDKDAALLRGFLDRYAAEKGLSFDVRRFADAFDFVSDFVPGYDIIFFDIEMPRMNGMEGARRIRARDEGAAIVFVTNMAQYAINGYEVNAVDLLLKPVTWSLFEMRIRRAVDYCSRRIRHPILVGGEDGEQVRIFAADVSYAEKEKITSSIIVAAVRSGTASASIPGSPSRLCARSISSPSRSPSGRAARTVS